MKLQEYQLKEIFRRYNIPLPEGRVTSIAREAGQIADDIDAPVIVKAQVLAEGRSLAGGIRLAKTADEAELVAADILSRSVREQPVNRVMVVEAVPIGSEYYLLITYDRAEKKPVLMMYESGNIHIETAAQALYENLERVVIDPLIGLQRYQILDLASRLDFPQAHKKELTVICQSLWQIFCDMDAKLAAFNPLSITADGRLMVLDGKLTVDDNAYYRQEMLFDFQNPGVSDSAMEFQARKYGFFYFKLDGNVGCLMNGAGLTMASLDYLYSVGARPANYLDMGGTVYAEKITKGMEILYADEQVKVIFVNVYGGKTHCDTVAEGLLASLPHNHRNLPIVVCFSGTAAEAGCEFLETAGITAVRDLREAVDRIMDIQGCGKWVS